MSFAKSSMPTIDVRRSKPKPTIVLNTYWKFACERQNVYFARIKNKPAPWTTDPIIGLHKFTNAYRAADRVSQYLIKNVMYDGPQHTNDLFLRTLLFKIFNKIETWEALEANLGEISVENFHVNSFAKVLSNLKADGKSIYSAAYIMPSGGKNIRYPQKHIMHLHLLKKMLDDKLPSKLKSSKTMSEGFKLLREYETIGDFLAYQFITDLNYSSFLKFSEMEFVVPGPGARDGLKKCFSTFGEYSESDTIRYVTEMQETEFKRLGLKFKNLWGRQLQLIDCQNLFCETDKYARVAHPSFKGRTERTRIKQKFSSHGDMPTPFFPPKWEINEKIEKYLDTEKTLRYRAPDIHLP